MQKTKNERREDLAFQEPPEASPDHPQRCRRTDRQEYGRLSQEFDYLERVTISTLELDDALGIQLTNRMAIVRVLGRMGFQGNCTLKQLIDDVHKVGPATFIRRLPDGLTPQQLLVILGFITSLLEKFPYGIQAPKHLVYSRKDDKKLRPRFGSKTGKGGDIKTSSSSPSNTESEFSSSASRDPVVIADRCVPELHAEGVPKDFPNASLQDRIDERNLKLHMEGKCKICHFHLNSSQGCRQGDKCQFCHLHGRRVQDRETVKDTPLEQPLSL